MRPARRIVPVAAARAAGGIERVAGHAAAPVGRRDRARDAGGGSSRPGVLIGRPG